MASASASDSAPAPTAPDAAVSGAKEVGDWEYFCWKLYNIWKKGILRMPRHFLMPFAMYGLCVFVPLAGVLWLAIAHWFVKSEEGPSYGPLLADSSGQFRLGVGIIVPFGFLWLGFVLPLLWSLYQFWYDSTWSFRGTCLQDPGLPPHAAIMEVDVDLERGGGERRRACETCGYQGNRVRHCNRLGRCAFMYDHWCAWVRLGVHAGNIKSFIVFLTFLSLYLLFVGGVWIFLMADHGTRYWKPFTGGFIILLVMGWLVAAEFRRVAIRLLFDNCLPLEQPVEDGWDGLAIRLSLPGYEPLVIPVAGEVPFPYNLGFWENFYQLLGPWFLLPAFWIPTPAMRNGPVLSKEFLSYARSRMTPLPGSSPPPSPSFPAPVARAGHSSGTGISLQDLSQLRRRQAIRTEE